MPVWGVGEALGRSQGGFSTKLHMCAEEKGKPIAAVLNVSERHEQFALDALMDRGAEYAKDEAARGRDERQRRSGLFQPRLVAASASRI